MSWYPAGIRFAPLPFASQQGFFAAAMKCFSWTNEIIHNRSVGYLSIVTLQRLGLTNHNATRYSGRGPLSYSTKRRHSDLSFTASIHIV
jgi:hypothetical protein